MDLEAFILVGGRSSRLGQPKALLQINGVTLAERAANTIAAALSPKEIYFAARDEKQFAAAESLPKDISLIYDDYKDRGAYSGLHSALNIAGAAKTEWIFVLACDYPLVPVELLTFLAGFINKNIDAVAPVQPDGRVQPLCAFYRVETCLKTVESFLSADEKLPPLRAVFEKVRTRVVKFEEISHLPGAENFFFNLNTPEDLERL